MTGTPPLAAAANPPRKMWFRLLGHYYSGLNLTLSVIEGSMLFGAFLLGVAVRFGLELPPGMTSREIILTGLVYTVAMSLSLTSMGLYQRGLHDVDGGRLRLAIAFAGGTAVLALIFYVVPEVLIGRGVIGLALLFSLIGSFVLRKTWRRLVSADATKRRVLVLGAGDNARRIADLTAKVPALGFVVVGCLPLPRSEGRLPDELLLQRGDGLLDLVFAHKVDEIVVASDDRSALPIDELLDCRLSGIRVLDQLTFFERELAMVDVDLLHPEWIVFSRNGFSLGTTGRLGKRLLDLVFGSLLLALSAPIMVLVAIASLIESRGRDPVLYSQTRVGEGGIPFCVYKFRSMRVDAEADGKVRWATSNDPRVTRLGSLLRRSRLDELPQLFNVLKGEMSLVGPRPERPEFVARLGTTIAFYDERHRVKPGLTGWAQLYYPYGASDEDAKRKLEFDLYYVKHANVLLDLIVLVQTVEVVLLGKGAR